MSFPQDSPPPPLRKYAIARTVLLIAATSVGSFGAIFAPSIFDALSIRSDDDGARAIAVIVALVTVVVLATAYALVFRAEKDIELRWMIAQNEAQEEREARAGGQTDTLPEGGPTLPE